MASRGLETDAARTALMKRVRRTRTSAENRVAKALAAIGLRYRRNVRSLPGSPDFANKRARWAIFVNGCFWHHHTNCRLAGLPQRNSEFWRQKLADNRRRDAAKVKLLRAAGLRVRIVWDCQTRDSDALVLRLRRVITAP